MSDLSMVHFIILDLPFSLNGILMLFSFLHGPSLNCSLPSSQQKTMSTIQPECSMNRPEFSKIQPEFSRIQPQFSMIQPEFCMNHQETSTNQLDTKINQWEIWVRKEEGFIEVSYTLCNIQSTFYNNFALFNDTNIFILLGIHVAFRSNWT